jgi:hypothetical protein
VGEEILLVTLTLAAYRAWRFAARDTLPGLADARDRLRDRIAERAGPRWAAGVDCPWCSGTWVAWIAVAAVWAIRPLPLPGLWFAAVAAGVGLLDELTDPT